VIERLFYFAAQLMVLLYFYNVWANKNNEQDEQKELKRDLIAMQELN
jgi:hypothetical protein